MNIISIFRYPEIKYFERKFNLNIKTRNEENFVVGMCIMCMAYKNKYIVSGFISDGCKCLENSLTILSFSLEDIELKLSRLLMRHIQVSTYSLDVEGRLYRKIIRILYES